MPTLFSHICLQLFVTITDHWDTIAAVCPKYIVAPGDSLYSISQKFKILPGTSTIIANRHHPARASRWTLPTKRPLNAPVILCR